MAGELKGKKAREPGRKAVKGAELTCGDQCTASRWNRPHQWLNVEIVVTRQLNGGGPVVMPLSPLSSFKTFILGHPRQFTLLPKSSALG